MSPLDISLSDLIARLDAEHADASNLDRVSEAGIRAQTLSDLGDQLVDHYIGEARQGGASWSEIGDAIGVSKQAAQILRDLGFTAEGWAEFVRTEIAARFPALDHS